jgi:hypothetical protein
VTHWSAKAATYGLGEKYKFVIVVTQVLNLSSRVQHGERFELLLSIDARASPTMPSFPTDTPFVGPLPYHLASRLCQGQAQQHTQRTLWEYLPTLTDEQWERIFAERQPLLWVDERAQIVMVAEEALPHLKKWALLYHASLDTLPTQQEFEGYYMARQLAYYCKLAGRLVAADPSLTHPDSIASMRAVFQRLCVGNEVAERLSERPKKPMHLDTVPQ